eukprot:CAMPEP_0197582678 /NCGR_PEP_ID=MMETSP1326-20131121/5829_1 /TAXON_ID=1155430 /ORGANISM="Genus nov. species nov., Strain RCC2288" /LENGTH=299 /DNA_ID=CAMNT_0043146799 /DNA_START=99 /DNA_END=995 /DNA_ORIENTATION=-
MDHAQGVERDKVVGHRHGGVGAAAVVTQRDVREQLQREAAAAAAQGGGLHAHHAVTAAHHLAALVCSAAVAVAAAAVAVVAIAATADTNAGATIALPVRISLFVFVFFVAVPAVSVAVIVGVIVGLLGSDEGVVGDPCECAGPRVVVCATHGRRLLLNAAAAAAAAAATGVVTVAAAAGPRAQVVVARVTEDGACRRPPRILCAREVAGDAQRPLLQQQLRRVNPLHCSVAPTPALEGCDSQVRVQGLKQPRECFGRRGLALAAAAVGGASSELVSPLFVDADGGGSSFIHDGGGEQGG